MPQYSCDGRGVLEFREGGTTYLSVNPTTRVATITKGCPIQFINQVQNAFHKFDWNTGACAAENAHISWTNPQ